MTEEAKGEFEPPTPNAEALPAGDFQASDDPNAPAVYKPSIPVHSAQEDRDEIMMIVRGSTLRRIRVSLSNLDSQRVDWSDLYLALFTLGGGAFIGSLAGTPTGGLGVLLRDASPLVAVGALVAFLFQRRTEHTAAKQVATTALDLLPDPDQVANSKDAA